jgi:adenosylhomocysteine nucleosidase
MATPPTSGRVAFICAMPMELRPLVKKLSLRKTQLGGVTVHVGTVADREAVAIVTGMGTKLATEGTRRLLEAVPVDHVIVVGITGAVENVTPIGTLILPDLVVNSATGEQHHPTPIGGGTHHGTMWTTDELLTGSDVTTRLREQGVVSLDMETAAIAAVCEPRGLPWSVFRVISDRATDGSVNEEVFRLSNQDGTPNWPAIVAYFAKHPSRIPQMARLAKGAKLATERAAAAAIDACSVL